MLKRRDEGFWCHVGGTVEAGEAGWQAMIREFREETGAEIRELFNADYIEQFYQPHLNLITAAPVFVAFWPPHLDPDLDSEHTEYRWCSLEQANALVPFPNQRQVYDHIWKNFVERLPSPLMKISIVQDYSP